MNTYSSKTIFVQRVHYKCKEANLQHDRTCQQLDKLQQVARSNAQAYLGVNAPKTMAASWNANPEKQNKYGVIYRCNRLGDMEHSKYLHVEKREVSQTSSYEGNRLTELDGLLSKGKMQRSFVFQDDDKPNKSEASQGYNPNLLSVNPPTLLKGSSTFSSRSKNMKNSHMFGLKGGFLGPEQKSPMTKSAVMSNAETHKLHRSIVFESEAYDQSKSGYLFVNSASKAMVDQLKQYLNNNNKPLNEPFYKIKTFVTVEDEEFEVDLSFKIDDIFIVYDWSCKKHYSSVSYFDRKFQFFNRLRIDIFQDQLAVTNDFYVEPFLHTKSHCLQRFGMQLKTTIPMADLSKTKTVKSTSAETNNFMKDHEGQLKWDEHHA